MHVFAGREQNGVCCTIFYKEISIQTSLSAFNIRLALAKLSKSTAIYLNGDTGFRLVIKDISFVRWKLQMIELRIHAFILNRLSREPSYRMHLFDRIFVSRNL